MDTDFIDEVLDTPKAQPVEKRYMVDGRTVDKATYEEILSNRIVRTHDAHQISYGFGNRAVRRASMRTDRGNPKKPKQYHKLGH